jgi:hypothetical protein
MITTEKEEGQEVPGLPEEEEQEKLKEILKNLKDARTHFSDWRNTAKENYDFFSGDQWSIEDRELLQDEGRPCVTFNRIARTVNAVAGLELQNRQEVRYSPRETSDTGLSDMLTSAAKWVRDSCDAEDEESEAFQDTLICGEGWTETRLDTESGSESKVCIDRIDPLEMLIDPDAKKRNHDDARWVARIKSINKKEFEALFPDADFTSGNFWGGSDGAVVDGTDEWKYENDTKSNPNDTKSNMCSVAQYQTWARVPVYKLEENGKIIELDEQKFNALKQILEAQGLPFVKTYKRQYKQYFLSGTSILDQQDLGCNHFTFKSITGLRDRNNNVWFGLVELMKDPQRWANKFFSQVQHIVNTGAKSGVYVEEGMIPNQRKFEENHAKPGSISVLRDGALSGGKFQQKSPSPYPDGVDRLLQYAIQSINDVPGVSLEFLGMAGRDQAMGLEENRKQAGVTVLANFFDSLRRYRKEQGRVLHYFIKAYISDGRLIRVLGEQGAQYIPLIKEAVDFEYDIIVDDAPTSPNMKERTFSVMAQLLPMALQAGLPVPPEILDYAPLPDALVQKWKGMLAKNQEDPTAEQMKQIQLMLAQLETQQKQADIQKTSSETSLNYAKGEQAHAIGQDEGAQAMQKMGMNHAEHQMKQEAMQREQDRKNLEMLLNMQRKELESKMNMRIKEQQVQQSNPYRGV